MQRKNTTKRTIRYYATANVDDLYPVFIIDCVDGRSNEHRSEPVAVFQTFSEAINLCSSLNQGRTNHNR